jgi:hypothetical protein
MLELSKPLLRFSHKYKFKNSCLESFKPSLLPSVREFALLPTDTPRESTSKKHEIDWLSKLGGYEDSDCEESSDEELYDDSSVGEQSHEDSVSYTRHHTATQKPKQPSTYGYWEYNSRDNVMTLGVFKEVSNHTPANMLQLFNSAMISTYSEMDELVTNMCMMYLMDRETVKHLESAGAARAKPFFQRQAIQEETDNKLEEEAYRLSVVCFETNALFIINKMVNSCETRTQTFENKLTISKVRYMDELRLKALSKTFCELSGDAKDSTKKTWCTSGDGINQRWILARACRFHRCCC